MVLFCHTALIYWRSPGELIIPAGRGKKAGECREWEIERAVPTAIESRMDTKNSPGVIRAIPASRGWSKFEMKLRLEEWAG
jgi:hypothetical protein